MRLENVCNVDGQCSYKKTEGSPFYIYVDLYSKKCFKKLVH